MTNKYAEYKEKCAINNIKPLDYKDWHKASSEEIKDDALKRQVDGNHYDMPIQPMEFAMINNLNFCQSNIVKYVCRYKNKNGLIDLQKAKHCIDLLIQFEGYEND